jgi:catechol 2,3-dioxygenase-like lactoylglutathione lyase family enzyme/ferredoxin
MPQITQKSSRAPLLKLNFISHGTLEVGNLQASRRFYEEVMGFEVIQRTPVSLLLRLRGDHTYVAVETRNPKGTGLLNHNGVDVSTDDDVRVAHEALVSVQDEYGIQRIEPPCWQHGVYSFFFADPDGNWWEILAHGPGGYSPEFDDPQADLTGRNDLSEDDLRTDGPVMKKSSPPVTGPVTEDTATMGLTVAVDRSRCIGSGNCAYWLPGVFGLDDQGYAFVADVVGAAEDEIVTAARRCPTRAITVERDGHQLA